MKLKEIKNSNDRTKDHEASFENDDILISSPFPQNFGERKKGEYKDINSQLKKSILFKLQTVDINKECQNEGNKLLEDFLKKRKEKLKKNRINAKKCRMKKKAYFAFLENKIKELRMELEHDNNCINDPQYSLKAFIIKALPKKLAFLSGILYNNSMSFQTAENIDTFIDNIKEEIFITSQRIIDNNLTFLINIYLEQVKILFKGFLMFYNENDKLFAMNNNRYPNFYFHIDNL